MAAPKPPQVLQLSPASEIVFEGPFKNVVTSDLELTNPSDKRVCFKVKTTAPRRYCVRPNSGIIEPGHKIKIHIMLQPLDAEGLAEGHKHKFMVQSLVLSDDISSLDSVWSQTDPRKFMDSKLRCIFHSSPTSAQPSSSSAPDTTSNPFTAPAPPSTATITSAPATSTPESPSNPSIGAAPPSTTTTTTTISTAPSLSSIDSAPNLTTTSASSSTTAITTNTNTTTKLAAPIAQQQSSHANFSLWLALFLYGILAMWFLGQFIANFWTKQA